MCGPAKGRKKSFKQLEDFCNKHRNLRIGELLMVFDVVADPLEVSLFFYHLAVENLEGIQSGLAIEQREDGVADGGVVG